MFQVIRLGKRTKVPPGCLQIAFLILTMIGVLIPLFMVDPNKMIRTDGTKVTTLRHPSWKIEIYGLWVALKTDPLIILLLPMFFASNWFYTWRMSHQFLNIFLSEPILNQNSMITTVPYSTFKLVRSTTLSIGSRRLSARFSWASS
jgi:hypothetical protein